MQRHLSGSLRWIIMIALAAGAALLLAVGPRAGDEFPADSVIVDYWEKWTGAEEAAMRAIVDDFNATVGKEKKIFVRYLSTSSIEQKTLVATAGGVPPDVAGLYNQNIPQFASLDALEPLDDLARSHGITPQTYKRVFWEECTFEGRLYGLVSSAFTIGLYYNTEIFAARADQLRAAGLDPSRPPRTIAELDAYAAALDQYDQSGRLVSAGYLPMEPGWYMNYTNFWFGGRWWDERSKRFTFTDPRVVQAYDWIQGYSRRLGPGAVTDFRAGFGNFDSPQNAFLAGMVAMQQQGTFLANFIRTQKPSMTGKWAAAPFPPVDESMGDVTYCNCDVLVIPRGARHKREAFEFIAFVNRQENMEKLARAHCKISPLADVSDGFLADHPNPYIDVFERLAESPNAFPSEPVPILPQVNHEINHLVQRLALLELSAAEGLAEVEKRLQQKYENFMQMQRRRRGVE